MSKSVKNIIIIAAVIVLLLLGVVIVNRIPSPDKQETTSDEEIYTIIGEGTSDIQSIEVVSAEGTVTAVNEGNSEWTISGEDSENIDSSKVYALAGTVSGLTSKNMVESSPSDISQYGLSSPQLTVTVNMKNGTENKLYVGDLSPTLGEYFVKKEGDDAVYTIYTFKVDTLKQPLSYYREFDRFNVNIDDISDIKIARSDETIEIKILDNIDKDTNNVWEMVSPYKSGANDDYIDNKILSPIEEISLVTPLEDVDGGFTSTSPVLTLTVKPYDNATGKYGSEYTETLVIGKTEGDKTYVKYKDNVYAASADSVSFANDSSYNIVSKLQALVDITEVKHVTLEYGETTHKLEIERSGDDVSFSVDGKEADEEISRSMYQSIIGLAVDGIYDGGKTGDTLLKITYKGVKSNSDTVIEIKEEDDLNCALTRNGETNFTIKKSKITEFIDLFEAYVQNPQ